MAQCIVDLSARAGELNEYAIQSILLVVAGSIADSSDDELAVICADFARLRLLLLKWEQENKDKGQETDS